MITSNDLKTGMTLVLKGSLHQIIQFQHIPMPPVLLSVRPQPLQQLD